MYMDRRGTTLVVIGLLLIPLTLLASLFLEMGKVYAYRTEAQLSADAAALAGGSGLLEAGDGGGIATARVHRYVNQNKVGDSHGYVDTLVVDVGAKTLHLVVGYETGPLMWAPSGIRLRVQAGAEVSGGTLVSDEGVAAPAEKILLR